eukprot:709122-Amphidinium_carterae.1
MPIGDNGRAQWWAYCCGNHGRDGLVREITSRAAHCAHAGTTRRPTWYPGNAKVGTSSEQTCVVILELERPCKSA